MGAQEPFRDAGVLFRLILGGRIRVITHRLRPVAFLVRDGDRIHALYVHRGKQGRGVASTLLQDAKQRSARLELWTAQDNLRARRLYERHGFYNARLSNGLGNDHAIPDVQLVWEGDAA
ncbi:MAG: GNAT family N-acetyltransferase [Rhodobacterales bacterium]|nr:MAG: GNAT family N-acetyltransferase [Rhodobacterales bacterium]